MELPEEIIVGRQVGRNELVGDLETTCRFLHICGKMRHEEPVFSQCEKNASR